LLAGCALLVVVSCGVQLHAGAAPAALGPAPRVTSNGELAFGAGHTFADGVTITVSTPKSIHPSAAAYPACDRAAAFEIEVTNAGADPYRLSGLSVTATVAGTQAIQVVDSTQGFNGIVDAGTDIAPGRTVQLNLAFAVPLPATELRLVLRPDITSAITATYSGPA
jgi:hypothetical protein